MCCVVRISLKHPSLVPISVISPLTLTSLSSHRYFVSQNFASYSSCLPLHRLPCIHIHRFVLQNLASGNWVKMPCSTYSVGLRLIASVGYWDVGVESIPEDYHTALKLYWGTGGRARCEPIYHPVLYQHIDGGSWLGGVNQRFQQVRACVPEACRCSCF